MIQLSGMGTKHMIISFIRLRLLILSSRLFVCNLYLFFFVLSSFGSCSVAYHYHTNHTRMLFCFSFRFFLLLCCLFIFHFFYLTFFPFIVIFSFFFTFAKKFIQEFVLSQETAKKIFTLSLTQIIHS